jgi:hypothetical protein
LACPQKLLVVQPGGSFLGLSHPSKLADCRVSRKSCTVQGVVQELDTGADLNYDFGGFGSTNGVYQGSNLSKGSFDITFNAPPRASGNRICPVEITAQVKVE